MEFLTPASWRRLRLPVLAAAAWTAVSGLFWSSNFGKERLDQVELPTFFSVREHLGKAPTWSQSLKIFVYDDRAAAGMSAVDLSVGQWATLLTRFGERQPRSLTVDKIFGIVTGSTQDFAEATVLLRRLPVTPVTGALVTPASLGERQELVWSQQAAGDAQALRRVPALAMADFAGFHAYGPAAKLDGTLNRVGHILLGHYGRVPAFLDLGNHVLPHLALVTAGWSAEGGQLTAMNRHVSLDAAGSLVVNFPSVASFYQHTLGLKETLERAFRGEPLTEVSPGDDVVILPSMYTGNADFVPTPLGFEPGGLVVSSLINSLVTGQMLAEVPGSGYFAAAAAALGVAAGSGLAAATFWLVGLPAVALWVVGALLLFAQSGVLIPWLAPAVSALLGGFGALTWRSVRREKKLQVLRISLAGALDPETLERLLLHPETVDLAPREAMLTIMFIDVVGFSFAVDALPPKEAFDHLRRLLARLGIAVKAHGGMIDKSLGDGLLCYFGHSFTGASAVNHAEQAVACAAAIQKENVDMMLAAHRRGEPVFPLRIGLNTDRAFLGDLRATERIEFTAIGAGVNFAKRLEGACTANSVMFSATTAALVDAMGLPKAGLAPRFVQLKHRQELTQVWEFDPLYDAPQKRLDAVQAYREAARIERLAVRWPLAENLGLYLICGNERLLLTNVSATGLAVLMPRPIGRGTRLDFALNGLPSPLIVALAAAGLHGLKGESRWSLAKGEAFLTGFALVDLSAAEGAALAAVFSRLAIATTSST